MVEYECQGGVIDLPGLKHNKVFLLLLFIIIKKKFKHAHKGPYSFLEYIYIRAAGL